MQNLINSAARARIDRRQLLVGGTALGAAAGLGLSSARAQTPKRGGRIRIGWNASSARDTLHPARLTSTLDWTMAFMAMNSLIRFNPDMSLAPDLAVEWSPSEEGRVWSFRLRDGVSFHNGKSLTSADVAYSLNLHRGPDTESPIRSWFAQVENIEAPDPTTIRLTLRAPNADLPQLLGWPNTVIVPEGHEAFNDNPIGSGPFQVQTFQPGNQFFGVRNPNYHFEGRPYLDEVEVFGISDTQARLNALMVGDVDYIVRVSPATVSLLERADGVTVASAAAQRHFTFPMMNTMPPFDNVDLRQALRYATDRQAMLENVLRGYGALGNDTPFAPSDPFYCGDIKQREYDVDRARYHMERSGLGQISIDLHTSEAVGSEGPDLALLLRNSAAAAGIDINVVRVPTDGYWSNTWMKQPFHMSAWMPRPSMDLILTQLYVGGADWNEGQFADERFDALVVEARSELDFGRRKELYCEVQQILHERGNSIIPLFTSWIDGRSDRVAGWTGHPFGEADGYRLAENAWLED